MLKKIITIVITLSGIFTIAYMHTNQYLFNILNAQSPPVFELPKGSKVITGKYDNREIVWDIGNNTSDYVLMSSKPITSISLYDSSIPITDTIQTGTNRENYCLRRIDTMNDSLLTYCPIAPAVNEINTISLNSQETAVLSRIPFLPSVTELYPGGSLGLSVNDRAYRHSSNYLLKGYMKIPTYSGGLYGHNYWNSCQNPLDASVSSLVITSIDLSMIVDNNERIIHWGASAWDYSGLKVYTGAIFNIRPFATLDKTKVNFAANTSYTDGSWHSYAIDTSNWNEVNELNPNKLRVQSSLTASLLDIKRNNRSISQVMENGSVDLSVNANTGTNTKMSVLLYDDAGTQIQYYKLGSNTQSGTNDYTIDLTGIPTGKYQVAVINEEYDASSQLAVESSPISDLLPLEIVEPHKITYTQTPQSGASAGNDYEFSKNVNAGQAVGKVTVNPTGVTPLTYTLETNGDNTYQNFEIDGLNSSGASSSTSLNVKIKSGAPDLVNGGLKAGTYKFCISAKDANGDPTTATSDTKVCTSFTVEKTDLSIAFNDPSQTKKSISDAATSWNETATANPNTGTKITYSVSGGDVSLISIDPDTGAITYTGSNAFGKVKIKATVDDDPSTGDDNYNSAFVEKEIVIYREVDGSVTPHSNSSDTTTPTFTASDSNISTGGIIGTIHGTLGTPDTIGGTTTTYHYGLKPGVGNASFFSVDANTGIIKTTANLGVNSYHITVTVSDNWSTKEIPVTINVGVAAAEDLKFYENSTSTTA
ncbi:cadherin repeat domain-containing protein, partial [bacterium c-19]|nr:cadherin repeat domain-containing protein [bacterium c-19]